MSVLDAIFKGFSKVEGESIYIIESFTPSPLNEACLPEFIPRSVFDSMTEDEQQKTLEDYWIPKEPELPLILKGFIPYYLLAVGRDCGVSVKWESPYEQVCAFHGCEMYKCSFAKIVLIDDAFYCPMCKTYYEKRELK